MRKLSNTEAKKVVGGAFCLVYVWGVGLICWV